MNGPQRALATILFTDYQRVRNAFEKFDKYNTGKIEAGAFMNALRQFGKLPFTAVDAEARQKV